MGFGPVYPYRCYYSGPKDSQPTYTAYVQYTGKGKWTTTFHTLTEWAHSQVKMYLEDKRKRYNSLKAAKQAAREWCK
jgi:hypothetical protein